MMLRRMAFLATSLALIAGGFAMAQNQAAAPLGDKIPVVPAPVLGPVSDFNAVGDMSGSALLGAAVRDNARETIGKVEEVYVSPNGEIKSVVLSIGGFLGIGSRYVLMSWNDLKFHRENDRLVLITSGSKELFKAMPEYSFERRPVKN
jgi:hypothetical protein